MTNDEDEECTGLLIVFVIFAICVSMVTWYFTAKEWEDSLVEKGYATYTIENKVKKWKLTPISELNIKAEYPKGKWVFIPEEKQKNLLEIVPVEKQNGGDQ